MTEKKESSGREIAGSASKNYIAKFLSFLFGIIYLFAIARVLGPEQFGQVIFLMTVVPGFALLFGIGAVQDVVVNFGSRYKDKKFLSNILTLSLAGALVLSAVIAAIGYYFPAFFANPPLGMFLLSIPLLALFVTYSFYYSLFQAFKRFGFLIKLVLLDSAANLCLAVVMYYVFGWGTYAVLAARALAYVVDIAYFLYCARSLEYSPSAKADSRELVDYSVKIFQNEIPKQLPGQLLNWLLGAYAPAKALGEYFFAQRIVSGAIDNIYSAIRETIYPYAGEKFKDPQAVKSLVTKSVRTGYLVHAIAFIALCVLIFPLTYFFFPAYEGSAPMAVLLAAASLLATITLSVNFLRVSGNIADSVHITLWYGACLVLLSIILVPMYGVYGAIIARLAGGAIQIGLYKHYLAKRDFKFSSLPTSQDAKAFWNGVKSEISSLIARAK